MLIARLDGWADRSPLTVGILHSSFNASEMVLLPAYGWVRLVVMVAAGLAAVALTAGDRAPARAEAPG